MTKKEFDIAGYKKEMARFLDDPDGKDRVFFEALDFAAQAHAGQWRKSGDAIPAMLPKYWPRKWR